MGKFMKQITDTAAVTMAKVDTADRDHWRVGIALFVFALLVRLAFLPFTTLDTGDTAARIWISWLWRDDPYLVTHGLWGPLHFYLIGSVLRFWSDPVWAPIALHMVIGSLIPILAYRLTFDLFGSRRSAIAAGLIFAFYPAAIAVSLGARAETPFMLFLGLGLIGIARAWRPDGRLVHALFAGLAVTLASMLRYEAWLLLPFLTLLLVRRPRLAAAFLATAMIHPIFWMIGNAVEYGNPLHSLLATSSWLEDVTWREPDTRLGPGLYRVLRLFGRTAAEITLPAAFLIAAGAIRYARQKRIELAWLIPPAALFLIFAISAFQDKMIIKSGYTTTFGLLLIPFVAGAGEWLRLEQWSPARCLTSAAVLLGAMAIFMLEPIMTRLPGGSWFNADPIPSIPDKGSVRKLQELIDRAGLRRDEDALVTDFFGLLATPFVAWQTRLHPREICRTPGAASLNVSAKDLERFLVSNRQGVLITRRDGRLAAHLRLESARAGTLAGVPLQLEPIGSLEWESKEPQRTVIALTVSRYQVVGMDEVPAGSPPQCTHSCPMSQCR